MLKITFIIIFAVLVTQAIWAKESPQQNNDVLAICTGASKSMPVFEILGDLKLFSGPRLTVQYANVVIKNIKNRTPFKGLVTLTKNAPYQYILNAFSTPSMTGALLHSEEIISLYGVSAGAEITIIKNRDGIEITSFSCALNKKLLLHP